MLNFIITINLIKVNLRIFKKCFHNSVFITLNILNNIQLNLKMKK